MKPAPAARQSTSSNWGRELPALGLLGEFLALAVSLEETGIKTGNAKAKLLGKALDEATGKLLDNQVAVAQGRRHRQPRQPLLPGDVLGPGPGRPGRRRRTESALRTAGKALTEQEATIVAELNAVQGKPAEIGGYYRSNPELTSKVMRPSATFNAAIDSLA